MLISLDKFSTEEINLMSIFNITNREALRNELVTALHDIYEPDMIEVFGSTMEKLDSLSDEEFAEIGFYVADDDSIMEEDTIAD